MSFWVSLFNWLMNGDVDDTPSYKASPTKVPNFNVIDVEKKIFRGGQPVDVDDWNFLKKLGVKTIVKLNELSEGGDYTDLVIKYCPISLAQQLIGGPSMDMVLTACGIMDLGECYVHCEHGQDRTGLVCGCFRVRNQGWKKPAAELEMLDIGFHKELRGLWEFWEDKV